MKKKTVQPRFAVRYRNFVNSSGGVYRETLRAWVARDVRPEAVRNHFNVFRSGGTVKAAIYLSFTRA